MGGGFAYVLIAAMAATSSDRAVARLGPRRWRRLHTLGAWYVWIVFAQSYAPRALENPFYVPFALAVLAAAGLRALTCARAMRRTPAASPVPPPATG